MSRWYGRREYILEEELYGPRGVNHYQNRVLCRISKTLGKCHFTLGNDFAGCNTRQKILGKHFISKGFFAEYFLTLGKEKHSAN
jgi:threonine dehydrogenase-like Zn-dependent dehydrogenase